jgi:hypothetical protein
MPWSTHHTPFYVGDGGIGALLDMANYTLTVPGNGSPVEDLTPANPYPTSMSASSFAALRDHKGSRYVFFFPTPDGIGEAHGAPSVVNTSWGSFSSNGAWYTSELTLEYSAGSLAGFKVGCKPMPNDPQGNWDDCSGNRYAGENAYKVQLGSPRVIYIGALPEDDDDVPCHNHTREAFGELTQLLNLKLFLDFPTGTPSTDKACHDCDPQNPNIDAECDTAVPSQGTLSTLNMLSRLRAYVASTPPSNNRQAVLKELKELAEHHRCQMGADHSPKLSQSELIQKQSHIRSYLAAMTKQTNEGQAKSFLQEFDQGIRWPFFVPPRACMGATLLLNLTNP